MDFELVLNGNRVHGRPGMTILELCSEQGIEIPTLCHHPRLPAAGICRLCVVELEGSRTLVPACATAVSPGMVILTHSARVIETRRTILELILASHPDACLVCDKGNRCELRKVAASLGIGMPQFLSRRHYHAAEQSGPKVVRDLSKCILCRRCIRACREIKKAHILEVGYRGFDISVIAGFDEPLLADVCQDCDVCISFCPVGALSRPEAREAAGRESHDSALRAAPANRGER